MKVNIKDVRTNMVLSKEIVDKGVHVLSKGDVLDYRTIQDLKRRGIASIEIAVSKKTGQPLFGDDAEYSDYKKQVKNEASAPRFVPKNDHPIENDRLKGIFADLMKAEKLDERALQFVSDYDAGLTGMKDQMGSILDHPTDSKEILGLAEIVKGQFFNTEHSYSNFEVINSINAVNSLDDETFAHSLNVALTAKVLGSWLKMNERELNILLLGGLIHDIGKLKLDQEILLKKGKLTDEEYKHIKTHPTLGYQLLQKTQGIGTDILFCMLQHHERADGKGYPLGLDLSQINTYARVIAIADVYDALTADRCYRKGMSPFEAASIIQKEAYEKYDTKMAFVFLENILQAYIGEEMVLQNGRHIKIIQLNAQDASNPLVLDVKTNEAKFMNDIKSLPPEEQAEVAEESK